MAIELPASKRLFFLISMLFLVEAYNIQVTIGKKLREKLKMNVKHLWTEEVTKWLRQEDQYLRQIVPENRRTNWTEVMEMLNSKFHGKERSAKQCRERYVNYSKFGQGSDESLRWSPQEFDILFDEFTKWGPRWNLIAKSLPQKSGNSIKNKFYGGLRKVIRRMNNIEKQQKGKIKKKLKYESVVRIIEAPECLSNLQPALKEQCLELRNKIIGLIRNSNEAYPQQQISSLINKINQFNLTTRSYRTKRRRNMHDCDDDETENWQQKSGNTSQDAARGEGKMGRASGLADQAVGDGQVKEEDGGKLMFQQVGEVRLNNVLPASCPALKEIEISFSGSREAPQDYILNILGQQSSPLEQSDLY